MRVVNTTAQMRDPEAGPHALEEIQSLFHRFRVETDLVHREQLAGDESRRGLVEQLVARQQLASLMPKVRDLHVADMAYVLEGLPLEQRMLIW